MSTRIRLPLQDRLGMAHRLKEALIRKEWPSSATMSDFGIKSSEHCDALHFAVVAGGVHVDQLAEVVRNGPAITRLIQSVPGNPLKDLAFVTRWDDL